MLSGNPLLLILGVISILVFLPLLRTRASKKQLQRNNSTGLIIKLKIKKKILSMV